MAAKSITAADLVPQLRNIAKENIRKRRVLEERQIDLTIEKELGKLLEKKIDECASDIHHQTKIVNSLGQKFESMQIELERLARLAEDGEQAFHILTPEISQLQRHVREISERMKMKHREASSSHEQQKELASGYECDHRESQEVFNNHESKTISSDLRRRQTMTIGDFTNHSTPTSRRGTLPMKKPLTTGRNTPSRSASSRSGLGIVQEDESSVDDANNYPHHYNDNKHRNHHVYDAPARKPSSSLSRETVVLINSEMEDEREEGENTAQSSHRDPDLPARKNRQYAFSVKKASSTTRTSKWLGITSPKASKYVGKSLINTSKEHHGSSSSSSSPRATSEKQLAAKYHQRQSSKSKEHHKNRSYSGIIFDQIDTHSLLSSTPLSQSASSASRRMATASHENRRGGRKRGGSGSYPRLGGRAGSSGMLVPAPKACRSPKMSSSSSSSRLSISSITKKKKGAPKEMKQRNNSKDDKDDALLNPNDLFSDLANSIALTTLIDDARKSMNISSIGLQVSVDVPAMKAFGKRSLGHRHHHSRKLIQENTRRTSSDVSAAHDRSFIGEKAIDIPPNSESTRLLSRFLIVTGDEKAGENAAKIVFSLPGLPPSRETTKAAPCQDTAAMSWEEEAKCLSQFAFPQKIRCESFGPSRSTTELHKLTLGQQNVDWLGECHVIVVKQSDGVSHRYGLCVRSKRVKYLEQGGGLIIPVSMVFVSKMPCFSWLRQLAQAILSEMHLFRVQQHMRMARESSSNDDAKPVLAHPMPHELASCRDLLRKAVAAMIPQPGSSVSITGGKARIESIRYESPMIGTQNKGLEILETFALDIWETVGVTGESIAFAIQALLAEKTVWVVHPKPMAASSLVIGVITLLRPLTWQGAFLPMLPGNMQALLHAPVPALLGLQELPASSSIEIRGDDDDVLVWDVERHTISSLKSILRRHKGVAFGENGNFPTRLSTRQLGKDISDLLAALSSSSKRHGSSLSSSNIGTKQVVRPP
mmetsp:Transcript_21226/g.34217  ORF Transcript_21226/g.34217 Transcript_21226/m.34217 type:complete len:993 (-) Transcript_21226:110-3088(-)